MNQRTRLGATPLIRAGGNGNAVIMNEMLQHGANIHATDDQGNTALIWAVENQVELDSIKLLLLAGADPQKSNYNGQTAIEIAKENECERLVNILKTYPDENIKSYIQQSFSTLKEKKEKRVQQLIRQLGDASGENRKKAMEKLKNMGEEIMYYLKRNRNHRTTELSARVRKLIHQMGRKNLKNKLDLSEK